MLRFHSPTRVSCTRPPASSMRLRSLGRVGSCDFVSRFCTQPSFSLELGLQKKKEARARFTMLDGLPLWFPGSYSARIACESPRLPAARTPRVKSTRHNATVEPASAYSSDPCWKSCRRIRSSFANAALMASSYLPSWSSGLSIRSLCRFCAACSAIMLEPLKQRVSFLFAPFLFAPWQMRHLLTVRRRRRKIPGYGPSGIETHLEEPSHSGPHCTACLLETAGSQYRTYIRRLAKCLVLNSGQALTVYSPISRSRTALERSMEHQRGQE